LFEVATLSEEKKRLKKKMAGLQAERRAINVHVAGVNIAQERVESIMAAVFGVLGLATCLG
jgi:hypothetical protein